MLALAHDEDAARGLIIRDVEHHGMRVIEIGDASEVFGANEIEELDAQLAINFSEIRAGKQTVWGTIHCYKGEGEA